jgi:hypothetical protein
MQDKATAEAFARDWIDSWNSRDLERVLGHYSVQVELSSPYIIKIGGEPTGILRGKDAVGAYWTKALELNPHLQFRIEYVSWGVNSVVINYRRHDDSIAAEWFEFGSEGKVVRSSAHYQS